MHCFCIEIAYMGVISEILLVVTKSNTSTPKIYNNVANVLQFVSCYLMFFSYKIKCNIGLPSKTTCSASSQITGVLENKIIYGSS